MKMKLENILFPVILANFCQDTNASQPEKTAVILVDPKYNNRRPVFRLEEELPMMVNKSETSCHF